jgi:hypothetical protein
VITENLNPDVMVMQPTGTVMGRITALAEAAVAVKDSESIRTAAVLKLCPIALREVVVTEN